MRVASLAAMEFLRVFRRRDGRWLLAIVIVMAACPTALLVLTTMRPAVLEGIGWVGLGRGIVVLASFTALPAVAHALATSSLREEIRSGSWRLLLQSPSSCGELLLGKALGLAAVVAVVQATLTAGLVATSPFAVPGDAAQAFEACAPLVLAFAMIPSGLAEARVQQSGQGYATFRILNLVQWLAPAVALLAAVPGAAPDRADAALAIVSASFQSPLLHVLVNFVPGALGVLAASAVIQGGLALVIWWLFVSREPT